MPDLDQPEPEQEAFSATDPALWKAMVEASLDLVAVVDTSGRLLYGNPAAVELFGDYHGVNLADLVHPDDVVPALALLAEGFGAPATRVEARVRALDGSWRVLDAAGSDLLTVPTAANPVVVTARDITERRAAEEALARRLDLQRVEQEAAVALASADVRGFAPAAREALGTVARGVGADAASLAVVGDESLRRVVEWHDPELGPVDLVALMGEPELRAAHERIRVDGRPVTLHAPDQVADPDVRWRSLIERAGLRSLVVLPSLAVDGVDAALNLCWRRDASTLTPPEVDALAVFAELLAAELRRSEALRAVADREELLRAVLDNTRAVVSRWTPDRRMIYANRSASLTAAQPVEALMGRTAEELGFAPDEIAAWNRATDAVLETRAPVRYETQLPGLDGRRWYSVDVAPELDEAGEVRALVCLMADVTAEHEAVFALAQRTAELEQAGAIGHLGWWYLDMADGHLEWSDEMYRIFGFAPGRVPSLDEIAARIPSTARAGEIRDASVRGEPTDFLERLVWPDGTERWVQIRSEPVFGDDGALIAARGVVLDVTEQHRLETDLHRERENLLALIEDSPDLIVRLDRSGEIVFINAACETVWGQSRAELLGRRAADVGLPANAVAEWLHRVDQVLASGRPMAEIYRLPEEMGGQWVEVRLVPERGRSGLVEHVIAIVRDVTEQHQTEVDLAAAAVSDPLTGLANRRLLIDALTRQIAAVARARTVVGVLYLDLDYFKDVNDSFGHGAGDELLAAMGHRLESLVRPSDLVARLGGDEFVVLVSSDDAAEVDRVAQRVLRELAAPIELRGEALKITTSIGVAVATAADTEPEDLLRDADLALYEAKEAGRNRIEHYDVALGERDLRRGEIAELLDGAVERRELVAHLQPEIDIETGRVVGVEALARWCRDGDAPEPAAAFLDLAYNPQLQTAIDFAVLEQAVEAVMALEASHRDHPLALRVNFSEGTLRVADIDQRLAEVLQRLGLDPGRITIEFDNRILDDLSPVERAGMEALQKVGVAVGFDNFGLGTFSLEAIRSQRVGRIAFARSVVAALGTDPVIDALVAGSLAALGRLGVPVTAVGVETELQLQTLRALGCRRAQGWLFADPGPLADIDALLVRGGYVSVPGS